MLQRHFRLRGGAIPLARGNEKQSYSNTGVYWVSSLFPTLKVGGDSLWLLRTIRLISVSHPLGVDTRPGRTPPGTGLGEALGERLGPSHHPTGRQQVCVPFGCGELH